jgi:hypothetical protein
MDINHNAQDGMCFEANLSSSMAFTSSSVGAGVSIFAIPIKLAASPLGFTVELFFVWSDRTNTLINCNRSWVDSLSACS